MIEGLQGFLSSGPEALKVVRQILSETRLQDFPIMLFAMDACRSNPQNLQGGVTQDDIESLLGETEGFFMCAMRDQIQNIPMQASILKGILNKDNHSVYSLDLVVRTAEFVRDKLSEKPVHTKVLERHVLPALSEAHFRLFAFHIGGYVDTEDPESQLEHLWCCLEHLAQLSAQTIAEHGVNFEGALIGAGQRIVELHKAHTGMPLASTERFSRCFGPESGPELRAGIGAALAQERRAEMHAVQPFEVK